MKIGNTLEQLHQIHYFIHPALYKGWRDLSKCQKQKELNVPRIVWNISNLSVFHLSTLAALFIYLISAVQEDYYSDVVMFLFDLLMVSLLMRSCLDYMVVFGIALVNDEDSNYLRTPSYRLVRNETTYFLKQATQLIEITSSFRDLSSSYVTGVKLLLLDDVAFVARYSILLWSCNLYWSDD